MRGDLGGRKEAENLKVSSASSLNISGVGPLTPEVKSAKKEAKRRGRRSKAGIVRISSLLQEFQTKTRYDNRKGGAFLTISRIWENHQ